MSDDNLLFYAIPFLRAVDRANVYSCASSGAARRWHTFKYDLSLNRPAALKFRDIYLEELMKWKLNL